MEFLNTCTTNALALADVDAIAFAAFSLVRTAAAPREWSPSQDVRAVEARLRDAACWVTQDATRPWLWLFKPVGLDAPEHAAAEPPPVEGYRLQRELSGRIKAAELARPPLRATHLGASASATASPASSHGAVRLPPGHSQPHPAEPPAPDCFTLYHLLISSVIGLVSYTLVKDCAAVALNYRTFVSRPLSLNTPQNPLASMPPDLHWLTSLGAHWTSSGTLLLSTITRRRHDICCLDRVENSVDQEQLQGSVIRVAPNGLLATIVAFDDPLPASAVDIPIRQKKRPRTSSLEQSIAKWKSTVTRWLAWRGFALPNLEKHSSWVRIRAHHPVSSTLSSPTPSSHEWNLLWPRALCFLYDTNRNASTGDGSSKAASDPRATLLKWFETADSPGFRDPLETAQEWAVGKADRDKLLETQRRTKLAEEDAVRRKEEQTALFPSSPRNTRNAIYGDLHAGGAVYPTPPDAIVVPATGGPQSDTTSVSGAAPNVILAPGGTVPAINLLAPQEHGQIETPQLLPSVILPSATESFNASGGNDDLFGDMDEAGYEGDNINEADFDFFDAPDDEDVDMLNAPPGLSNSKVGSAQEGEPLQPMVAPESQIKRDDSDPSAALERALCSTSLLKPGEQAGGKRVQPSALEAVPAADTVMDWESRRSAEEEKHVLHEATPLDPSKMAQTLRPAATEETMKQEEKEQIRDCSRDRAFDPLHFSRKMSLTDAKYQDGRFAVGRDNATAIERRTSLKRNLEPGSLRDQPLMTRLRHALGVASTTKIPEITALARAVSDEDLDASSVSSEASEYESEEETDASPLAFLSGLNIPVKRKLPTDGNATPMSVTSFADSWGGDWHDDLQALQLDEAYLTSLEPSSWDWSLVSSPAPAERSALGARFHMPALPPPSMQMPDTPTSQPDLALEMPEDKSPSGKDSIIIAQIVTDQIVSATLDILNEDAPPKPEFEAPVSSETRWHVAIKNLFPNATACTVPTLAAVNDVFPDFHAQGKGQQRPPPRKHPESTAPGSQIFPLHPPFLRLRRADTHWDLLPPAVAFWEHLGLSPASPAKNVVAFCIYPHSASLRSYLEDFLLNLQLAYDSCKLGSHGRVETVAEFEGGLVPCKLTNPSSEQHAFTALKDTCVELGKVLAMHHAKIQEQQEGKIDAFVMYMVDPFGDPSALWDLCQSFWALFQAYGQGSPGRPDTFQKPDLVLQVVPIKYLASFDAPVVLDPSTYINLAREVYDRCPPSAPSGDKTCLSIYSAPALQLEETIPRSIPFKLLSEPPQDLLRENGYMHLGYAISLDGTWITAAWTDTCGKSQAVVSYHLGTRVFGEIAKEIWQTTIEILQSRRVHWRICIAKAGVMEREELETWVLLLSYPAQLNLFVTLLSVDTEPPFKFTPTPPAAMPSSNTPTSTPQPGVSPDPTAGLTPAATPSAESSLDPSLDPEARLVDLTDETWGVTLAHRLHNSHSTNHFSPALISGLLVKRGQTLATSHSISQPIPDPLPGPIIIAVNILWIGAVGSTRPASPFSPADSASPLSSSASPAPSPYSPAPQPPQPQNSPLSADAAAPRSTSSLMWTPTAQTRSTAENLLKEILAQFRALGVLARLRGMRGARHGSVPWHLVAAERGVAGLDSVVGGVR